jgi:acyl-CoA thioesterase-1
MLGAAILALVGLAACGGDRTPAPALPLDGYGGEGAASREVAVPEDAPLVVFLGDSLSAGLHLAAEESFPAAAQRLLADRGRPFRLVNAGVSGDTTAGGLARLDWLLRQEPAVVVVELGGNDALRGIPLESVEENLRRILRGIREAGARALLLGMDAPASLGPGYASGFSAVYARLAEELEVPLVPGFLRGVGGVPAMNLPDGLHPTPEGHRLLAENLADGLEALLATTGD